MRLFAGIFLTIFVPVTLVLMLTLHYSAGRQAEPEAGLKIHEVRGKSEILSENITNTQAEEHSRDAINSNFRILLISVAVSGLISFLLAGRISIPMRKLADIADRIEAGDKNISFPVFGDKTMSKVADIFHRMYSSMTKKQNELENERHKLQHVFSILNEGIILLDTSHKIKHFNSKAVKDLGTELTLGKNIVDSLNNMDTINFVSRILEWNEDGIHHLELRQKIFDTHVRHLDNEILIVLYNITERTQYEDFKTELIGNITHELKTPLAMIMGYAETLLGNTAVDRKNLEKFLTIIHSNSKRLNNIINDILELHRLEHIADGFSVDEPLQLDSAVSELEERYEGFEVKTLIKADCTEIPILREHFMTLVTNLTDNAHKYSTGKVIEISISRKDDEIVIHVADEGPAIPDEDRERIFERFYTVNKSKNRNQTGTGLGLSIVKHITGLYDGSITLEKNSRGGNTFTATLFERPAKASTEEDS